MSELYITAEERTKLASFMREQEDRWNQQESEKMYAARAKGNDYEPQPFAGFDQGAALTAIRSGWKSRLSRAFERKARREGWKK